MKNYLREDQKNIDHLLELTKKEASAFLGDVEEKPVGVYPDPISREELKEEGIGGEKALEYFKEKYAKGLTASAGPRYFGFVIGGTTPAALMGDWLVSTYDQNALGSIDSSVPYVERETIGFLKSLFSIGDEYSGSFVSGATMANFVGLALGRQWLGHQSGLDIAKEGLSGLSKIKVLSGSPHASILKALSMLGMGRDAVELIPCLDGGREAVDLLKLEEALIDLKGQACIVVANAGTVNTVDFDDLEAIADLQEKYPFWLHIDAAFGGFAACSPKYKHLTKGMGRADSITIDAHKWLNVPYDSAMQFTKHKDLQVEIFKSHAAYLGDLDENVEFMHLTPETSRRFRALPAWFTLMAYGKEGHRQIVENNCDLAFDLGEKIKTSSYLDLLAPVHSNVVCFTLKDSVSMEIPDYLEKIKNRGKIFLTPTVLKGKPAIRVAFSNWRTTREDLEIAWNELIQVIEE